MPEAEALTAAGELDGTRVWDEVFAAGHGDCLGWTHDPATGDVRCACETVLFRAVRAAAA